MWVITDDKDVVVDKASHLANLSRGYILAGVEKGDDDALIAANYKKYEITKPTDIRIWDTYNGTKVTINVKKRATIELDGIKRQMVETAIRQDKINTLGLEFTDIKTEFDNEYTELNTRKIQLEAIIAAP